MQSGLHYKRFDLKRIMWRCSRGSCAPGSARERGVREPDSEKGAALRLRLRDFTKADGVKNRPYHSARALKVVPSALKKITIKVPRISESLKHKGGYLSFFSIVLSLVLSIWRWEILVFLTLLKMDGF